MTDDFAMFVERERERIAGEQQTLYAQRCDIDAALTELGREAEAINAYEAAKNGKAIVRVGAATPRVSRSPNGSRRESILRALRSTPSGMTRGELLTAEGVKGDRSGEGSVSNALSQLQKAGRVVRQDSGRWAVAAENGMRQESPGLQRAAAE